MPETYIERYQLNRKISIGKPNTGAPDLWLASDAGDVFYLKVWHRPPDQSHAIRAMWNREIRGLMRLQGYPGASEIFIRLRDWALHHPTILLSSKVGDECCCRRCWQNAISFLGCKT
jgi:hypothetical protein